MKISFPALFQTPLHKYNFFFIFGNDATVFERIISYLQKKLALPIEIKGEENLFLAGSSQLPLFEKQIKHSLTLIPAVTDKILNHLNHLKEGTFIFTSEKARAQSKLVTFFSQSSCSLAIAAYASPLTTSEFEFLIGEMSLPLSFRNLLFKAYQHDYMGLLTALEKIKIYGGVPEAHYASFLESSFSSSELAPLLHALLLKDAKKITELFSLMGSADLIPFLRSLMRSFQTLFDLIPLKKSSKSIAWQKLSPPVFFKEQPIYESALSKWQPKEIQTFLESLLRFEREVKYVGLTLSQVQHELLYLI